MLIEFLPESSKFLRCENIVRDKIAVSEGKKRCYYSNSKPYLSLSNFCLNSEILLRYWSCWCKQSSAIQLLFGHF